MQPEHATQEHAADTADKFTLTPRESLRVPLGGQEIALQQLDFAHGGMSLLRVRIREGKRFTIFDVDPVTARAWGEAMVRWSAEQGREAGRGKPEAGRQGGG